ncbi:MAG: hypothetical protein KKF42_03285 [Actinobacteria bacterium]|nr:hypothetical protein [Actinomycetota bacterium]
MSTAEHAWSDRFVWHIRQAPFQLMHMRELVESTIAAQDTSAVRVAGGRDTAPTPYRVEPADDADLLYATLVIFGREVAEKIGGSSPRALRARMWTGRDEPQGLPVCTPGDAFALAAEIITWLDACSHHIAHDSTLHDAPDDLCELIRQMRTKYPRSMQKFKWYADRPCTRCGEKAIERIFDEEGLAGARCDGCGTTWVVERD